MANLFDVANAPEGEPTEVIVGDFLQWKRTDIAADYPPSLYSAEYVARITGGGENEIKLAATELSDSYLFTVDSATSADFSEGDYHWQLEITQTSSGNRVIVDTGMFTAIPDLDSNQADPRIHAERMLALVETALEAKAANGDVAEYTINGRSLKKMSFQELTDLRDMYRREVTHYKNKELVKRGKSNGATIKVRF